MDEQQEIDYIDNTFNYCKNIGRRAYNKIGIASNFALRLVLVYILSYFIFFAIIWLFRFIYDTFINDSSFLSNMISFSLYILIFIIMFWCYKKDIVTIKKVQAFSTKKMTYKDYAYEYDDRFISYKLEGLMSKVPLIDMTYNVVLKLAMKKHNSELFFIKDYGSRYIIKSYKINKK